MALAHQGVAEERLLGADPDDVGVGGQVHPHIDEDVVHQLPVHDDGHGHRLQVHILADGLGLLLGLGGGREEHQGRGENHQALQHLRRIDLWRFPMG